MKLDKTLEQASATAGDSVNWGNYDDQYDWVWNDMPLIIPKILNTSAGVMIRDWAIAKELKKRGVRKVLDIGSDTGHFLAVLKYFGIDAVGVDANKEVCEKINKKGQNKCYNVGIQTLVTLNLTEYDCITCMNITQAKWDDENLKNQLIKWIREHSKYAVLSDFTHQDKKWLGYTMVHDFNLLPFYCSSYVVRAAAKLNIEKIISYTGIQKLYEIKKR